MSDKLPFANLSQDQLNSLAEAESRLNTQMGNKGEIILLAYKNENR